MNRKFTEAEIEEKVNEAKQRNKGSPYFKPPGKAAASAIAHNEVWDYFTSAKIPFTALTQGTFRFYYKGHQVDYYIKSKKYKIGSSGAYVQSKGLETLLRTLK